MNKDLVELRKKNLEPIKSKQSMDDKFNDMLDKMNDDEEEVSISEM